MTDPITIPRALLEQVIQCGSFPQGSGIIHDLRAELAKPEEPSYTATQLAAMVLSDCGISTDCTMLHERVARRIALHEEQLIDNLQKLPKPVEQDQPVAWGMPDVNRNVVDVITDLDKCEGMKKWGEQYSVPLYLHPPTPAWHDAPEVAALKAERDAAIKDAERYRWLRRESVRFSFSAELVALFVSNQAELDGAIRQDAAIAKAEGRTE